MTTPLDIPHFIEQIYQLDGWINAFPLTQEYRERTTYREFQNLMMAKEIELGLTPEVSAQLRQIKGNEELDRAWLELAMTEDERELLCPSYYRDLPLNYYWMPEYEAMQKAVDDFIEAQPMSQVTDDAVLLDIVHTHMAGLAAGTK